MNLQDYSKWAEWDYKMEHPQRAAGKPLPLWFYPAAVAGILALWAICILVEIRDYVVQADPIEIFVALWAIMCAGLFLAGMIVAIF